MRILRADATPLFASTAGGPRQVVRVTLAGEPPGSGVLAPGPVLIRVEGPGVSTARPARIESLAPAPGGEPAEHTAEVPVTIAAPHGPGSRLAVTVIAEDATSRAEHRTEITAAEPGWTIWMVCH